MARIGVIGSLGTAGLAYLAAGRQARDRGRIEYAQKLREERRAAYRLFQQAAEPIDDALHRVGLGAVGGPASPLLLTSRNLPLSEQEISGAVQELRKLLIEIQLNGPATAAAAAQEVYVCGRILNDEFRLLAERIRRAPWHGRAARDEERRNQAFHGARATFDAGRDVFARVSRSVVEDHGLEESRPRPRRL
ncbi:hypothetical protein ACFVWY_34655 [Streptomyces sp. NPDC058195]|uniref:hypothetical protein n=1 Tax=Streptomyces sp. NPDC058195 TaxID=3346375 RepID=UPI0036E60D66